ncbi:dTDP-4-dehydrorhamnose 3,5-epimerase [Flavihumibacter petaseus]|uniref:dTDP-4-dehydrorhamnose 3,5-epimerase n=1 Tax=Flavihumibacter petaseus NBRC 106054 TaxID=1220578 RepID=A0A0E9MVQ7_9BACT|nr:dTDP-4-dehydrorhamnose 3,5-epimerase [Flavihumibacter petaseus]GAO41210.1 dTDP-4-dehydrorhamnose 3,5-epimerase [Flavihumibacter petaseus NBRC 106054]
MGFIETGFQGLWIFEPKVFGDDRGYFYESYSARAFQANGLEFHFVQDNQARSSYGVVRGLHYQEHPYCQTKLIRALEGTILDVVVDCRKGSPTYGKVFSIELSAENKKQLLIPAGFAHGYSVLTEQAEVMYKVDRFYHKESEGGILFSDPALAIDWKVPAGQMILSEKDKLYPTFAAGNHSFFF